MATGVAGLQSPATGSHECATTGTGGVTREEGWRRRRRGTEADVRHRLVSHVEDGSRSCWSHECTRAALQLLASGLRRGRASWTALLESSCRPLDEELGRLDWRRRLMRESSQAAASAVTLRRVPADGVARERQSLVIRCNNRGSDSRFREKRSISGRRVREAPLVGGGHRVSAQEA